MENATKALLIAAAVLIAIVLIALGVNLLNAGSDTAGEASKVSTGLQTGIEDQTSQVVQSLGEYQTATDAQSAKQ